MVLSAGIGLQWIGVTSVLGWIMTAFTTVADPSNSNAHFVKGWSKPAEWLFGGPQGKHLAQKHLDSGVLRLQHPLQAKDGAKIDLMGLLEVHESRLVRVRDAFEAVMNGSYAFVDEKSDEELVSVYWKWNMGSTIKVWSIAFGPNQELLDGYFHGIKFTQPRKLEFVIQDFEFYAPISSNLLLLDAGYLSAKPIIHSPVVVETDWDM